MMKMTTRKWLVAAALLVLGGGAMFGGAMCMLKWDFTKLSTTRYESNEYGISDKFSNILVEMDTADLVFALSDDGNCKVKCFEERKAKHSVSVEADSLVIRINNEKSWYDNIGIHFGSPKITVYLPNEEYSALLIQNNVGNVKLPEVFKFESVDVSLRTGNVDCFSSASGLIKIKTNTGDINIKDIAAEALDVSTSTGRIIASGVSCEGNANINVTTGKTTLTDFECKNLMSSGSTGSIILENTIADEAISIKRSTGDLRINASDAAGIFAETTTGDITGTLLSEKTFYASTKTGSIDVPKTFAGGRCEVNTNTGDIKLDIQK